MRKSEPILVALLTLLTVPAWSQANGAGPTPPLVGPGNAMASDDSSENSDRMLTPPPVSGQSFPTVPLSEERSNYLNGGLAFTSAYTDNVLGAVNGHPLSDVSYSLAPMLTLDQTTPRAHELVTYAPGFTFYQRTSARNEADQNASLNFDFRLSPHVTFTATDRFQKTSNVFSNPDFASFSTISGSSAATNFSIIPPVANVLINFANTTLTYQFGLNEMIGVSGTFSNLHFANLAEVPGLYDGSAQSGSAFYSHRFATEHYVGATYQFQRLVSYPTAGALETQTHAGLLFYTFLPSRWFSFSVFGGPQYADTTQPQPQPVLKGWNPSAGTSASWQGRVTAVAVSYSHSIAGSGGLIEAVHMDNASASLRQQLNKTLTGTIAGAYIQNNLLSGAILGFNSGHSVSATASLQQQLGQHFTVQLGYTRLHQSYSNVAVISLAPDTNREFFTLSYQFSRPLGK